MKYLLHPYIFNKIVFSENSEIKEKFDLKKKLIKYEINLQGYTLLFSYFDFIDHKKDTYIYPKTSNPECIFCLKKEPAVTFKTRAHVIPECLGNKYLLQYDECDQCNEIFSSTLEDALDKYTEIFRTFNRTLNKKNKVVTHKSIDQSFTYEFNKNNGTYQMFGENFENYVKDDENGKLTIDFEIKKHRPLDVYRAFMKIFYGLLPREHHRKFTMLRDWIMDKNPNSLFVKPLTVMRSWIPGMDHKPLAIFIINNSKKDCLEVEKNFDYMGLISIGNVVFEMPIISDDFFKFVNKDRTHKINFNLKLFPKPRTPIQTKLIDLSISEKITDVFSVDCIYEVREKLLK